MRSAILSLFAVLAFFVGCNDDSAGPEQGTTVRDVEEADGPFLEGLLGTTVTVSGDVSAVYDERAFEIAGDDIGGEGILVVVPTAEILDEGGVEEGELFQVTGEIQRLVTVDIEREYDLDFDADIEAEFEDGGPMIVAENIEPALREGVGES